MYAAMTKDEDNAADGRFSAACSQWTIRRRIGYNGAILAADSL
jgi:hypothetical protein